MRNQRSGFTLIELLIAVAIIAIMAAIAVGPMSEQLKMARESSVIQEFQTIHTAEAQYFGQFGKFARSLASLGPPVGAASGPEAARLIPENLASGKKSGYIFEVRPSDEGYAITAVPKKFGSTGRRSFYSDQTLVIRESWTTEPASVSSPSIQ
jgi:type IV pilus assembly protein PilA